MKKKLSYLFLLFLAYAIIGWCYEVVLEVFIYRWGFSNRGFLFGPYCPVYGFGALFLLFCLNGVRQKKKWYSPILVFLGTVVITTALELLTSYILEFAIGHWLWDYTRYRVQFDGRIALDPSIRFGLGGLFFLYAVQPMLEKLGRFMGEKDRMKLASSLFFIVLIDFIGSMVYRVL